MSHDDIEASRAPLIDHLIELRQRLIKSLIAFFGMFIVSFFFAKQIYNVLLIPYIIAADDVSQVKMIYTAPLEYFFTQLKIAAFGAAFFSFPVVATQVYKFVAPGLYANERDAFRPYLVATPILFLLGSSVVMFIAMPMLMKFSLGMQQMGGEGTATIELLPKVSEYLSLIMTLIFAFGLTFQLPVLLTLLAQAGFIDAQFLREKRRYAIVGVFIVAAIVTPPDVLSQLALAVPTLLLYEVSILAVQMVEKKRLAQKAADDAETGAST